MKKYTASELESHAADVKAALADERDPKSAAFSVTNLRRLSGS